MKPVFIDRLVHLCQPRCMKQAWLKQSSGPWVERFWPNPEAEHDGGVRPVLVDLEKRLMLDEPPLLKSRRQQHSAVVSCGATG